MRTLIPIKIKVVKGSGSEPQMVHPSYTKDGLSIAEIIDRDGIGMNYEKVNTIPEDDVMYAITALPTETAQEFASLFPDKVEILTDAQAKKFWEENVTVYEPSEIIDVDVLQGIKLKMDLGLVLNKDDQDALDVTKNKRGIRKNPRKNWADFKAHRKF